MARIIHPRFQPGRVTEFGIEFVDGFAEVDLTDKPILHQALVQHGYGIEEASELEAMTVPELKALADDAGIEYDSKTRKPELVDALNVYLSAAPVEE